MFLNFRWAGSCSMFRDIRIFFTTVLVTYQFEIVKLVHWEYFSSFEALSTKSLPSVFILFSRRIPKHESRIRIWWSHVRIITFMIFPPEVIVSNLIHLGIRGFHFKIQGQLVVDTLWNWIYRIDTPSSN